MTKMKVRDQTDFRVWMLSNGYKENIFNGQSKGFVSSDKTHILDFGKDEVQAFDLIDTDRIQNDDLTARIVGQYHSQINDGMEKMPAEAQKNIIATVGILPEFFTDELMQKWQKLTGLQRLLMVQQTPEHQIFILEVGKENGKPVMASFVKGNYMITEANFVFLFDWDYRVIDVSISETGVSVRGIFVGMLDGKEMTRSSVGYQERNKKMDAQQAQKAALTDSIKKALSYMGFNRDVYGGEALV